MEERPELTAIFYTAVMVISMILASAYIYIWHKHFDVNFTMIFTLVPVSCIGYLLFEISGTPEGCIRSTQIIYIGGCFLQLFMLLSIFNLCGIKVAGGVRCALFASCVCIYASVLTIGHMDIFYKSISYVLTETGRHIPVKEYGFMHTAFLVQLLLFFMIGITAIVYCLLKKKQVPRTVLCLLVVPDVICILSFFIGRRLIASVDFVPLGYVIAEAVYLMIAYRVNLYDISDTVIDSMMHEQKVGYVSFDFKCRYLGSNEVAKELVPELKEMSVDGMFGYKPSQRRIRHFLDSFQKDNADNTFLYTVHGVDGSEDDERFYNANVNYLYDGIQRRGYIVTFTDDTANKKYIRLLDDYNDKLKGEVEEKTGHIVQMHDNLIMSLAMMVESRDNSTGGHIKRTSEGVRILVDEIKKEGVLSLSEEFCADVIKAAPMHDLGKIAVDDAVLRKPGRFTDEEFEKMKTHAAEGARVIHEILLNTDDESFKKTAENVAHYHHERWDGSGYPEKLSGEDIPLEARIMAIADVYDALVSKRVYKEAFDFKKADSIIMEGMGSQFDPHLRSAYENARPRLEEYYNGLI